jgi:hypothetical protein
VAKPPLKRKALRPERKAQAVVPAKPKEPTFHTKFIGICERLSFLGQTNQEMHEALGVSHTTFYEWLKLHPQLAEAVEKGREPATGEVARSLYQRAVGYVAKDQQLVMKQVRNEAGKIVDVQPVVITLEKEYPPDTTAAMAWLTNRQPQRWRNKQDHDINLNVVVRRALLELPED